MKNERAIYALYSENKFVSWLYGAFAQLTTQPKPYWCGSDHEKQSAIILENVKDKIERAKENTEIFLGIEKFDNFIAPMESKDYKILNPLKDFTLGVFFVEEFELNIELLEKLAKCGVPNVQLTV